LTILPDGPLIHETWRQMIVDYRVSGVQVHDARIVAAMQVHQIPFILTLNSADFRRYTGISILHPEEVAKL
jgi:hypothetical protein